MAALSAVVAMAAPAHAAGEAVVGTAEVDALAGKGYAWQGWSDSRPISPQVGLPHELNPSTAPFSRAFVDSVPGGSAAWASLYYGDEIVEEGILEIAPGGGVRNPTLPRCGNPGEYGTGGTVEFGGGGVGAASTTDCTSQLRAFGVSTFGPVQTDGLTVASGLSRSETMMEEGVITGEVTSQLHKVKAGDLVIDTVMSWLKVTYPVGEEPKISYRITANGVKSADTSAFEAGAPGWSLGGNDIPAGDLVKQFNTQSNKTGAETAPDDQTWEIDLMAPRVYRPGDRPGRSFTDFSPVNPNEILVYAPFLRLRSNQFSCCKNGNLENAGFHLAFSRVRLYIETLDGTLGDKVLNSGFEDPGQSDQEPPEGGSAPVPVGDSAPAAPEAAAPSPPKAPTRLTPAAWAGTPVLARLETRPVAVTSPRRSGAGWSLALIGLAVAAPTWIGRRCRHRTAPMR